MVGTSLLSKGMELTQLAASAAVITMVGVSSAAAGYYDQLPESSRTNIQDYLVWTGHFDGAVTGKFDDMTLAAISDWQRDNGKASDGTLGVEEARLLNGQARENYDAAKFTIGRDGVAGLSYGLPYAYVEARGPNEWNGSSFAAADETIRMTSFRLEGFDAGSMEEFGRAAFSDVPGYEVTSVTVGDDRIDVVGGDATETLHLSALLFGDQLRGYFVWAGHDRMDEVGPSLTAMRNSMKLSPVETDGVMASAPGPNHDEAIDPVETSSTGAATMMQPSGSGTGFAVNDEGYFVTNNHVVLGCSRVDVGVYGDAEIVRVDAERDLALLRVPTAAGSAHATISTDDAMLAEDVYAFGYPLPQALGNELGFSRGSVSATVGLRADRNQFRMTAQVQPGNSGGPLVDASGRVVGVVASKLDAMAVANATGDIPQNMNFAVKADTLRTFLDASDVDYSKTDRSNQPPVPAHEIARNAAAYTQQVLCYP